MTRTKEEIRKEILQKRDSISMVQRMLWDVEILKRISASGLAERGTVCLYSAVHGEAGTDLLFSYFREKGCRVAFPRVEEGTIRFYYVEEKSTMVPGAKSIPEPAPGSIPLEEDDCPVLVPGLAFSEDGWRIGYGAGHFDRFFSGAPRHERIALAYEYQVYDTLPHDDWDCRVHRILTPEREIEAGSL